MSYLKFDKTVMINLEESLTREVLRTNRWEPITALRLLNVIPGTTRYACACD